MYWIAADDSYGIKKTRPIHVLLSLNDIQKDPEKDPKVDHVQDE